MVFGGREKARICRDNPKNLSRPPAFNANKGYFVAR